jgi:hypothetical protein
MQRHKGTKNVGLMCASECLIMHYLTPRHVVVVVVVMVVVDLLRPCRGLD